MPTGIIMASSSVGATQEDIEKVLTANGMEPDKPAVTEEAPVEPKREDFKTDEEFETAHEDFTAKQEEAAEAEEERKEKERLAALPRLSRREKAVQKATQKLQDDLKAANDRIAALEGKKPAAAPQELKEPKREDFKSDEEFDEAKFQYRYKVQRAKEERDNAQTALQEHIKETRDNYEAARLEIKEEYADWDETLEQMGKTPVSDIVLHTILGLEEGPRVTYYLAKHPDQLSKLNGLFPDAAIREVIRLHDRLKTKSAPAGEKTTTPKTKPRLPEPVRPISTAATASTMTSADAAKAGNFKAFKRAQAAGR